MDKIIHCTARLTCRPERASEMFTRKRDLETWLAPLAEVEAVEGGSYELFWEPDDRENNSTIGCKITGIEAGQFLSFEWRSPKQFKHFANSADPLTHVVVFFIPVETGVEVHLVHSGWRSAPEWEEARTWQYRAWETAFRGLEEQINS